VITKQYVMIQNIHERTRSTGLIWADKIALLFVILFSSLLLYLWSFAFLVIGNLGAKHLWAKLGILGVELETLTIGSAWIMMRVADFLAGGLKYRLIDDRSAQKMHSSLYDPLSNERHHVCGTILAINPSPAIELVQL
jgi:hypothetical protein